MIFQFLLQTQNPESFIQQSFNNDRCILTNSTVICFGAMALVIHVYYILIFYATSFFKWHHSWWIRYISFVFTTNLIQYFLWFSPENFHMNLLQHEEWDDWFSVSHIALIVSSRLLLILTELIQSCHLNHSRLSSDTLVLENLDTKQNYIWYCSIHLAFRNSFPLLHWHN